MILASRQAGRPRGRFAGTGGLWSYCFRTSIRHRSHYSSRRRPHPDSGYPALLSPLFRGGNRPPDPKPALPTISASAVVNACWGSIAATTRPYLCRSGVSDEESCHRVVYRIAPASPATFAGGVCRTGPDCVCFGGSPVFPWTGVRFEPTLGTVFPRSGRPAAACPPLPQGLAMGYGAPSWNDSPGWRGPKGPRQTGKPHCCKRNFRPSSSWVFLLPSFRTVPPAVGRRPAACHRRVAASASPGLRPAGSTPGRWMWQGSCRASDPAGNRPHMVRRIRRGYLPR